MLLEDMQSINQSILRPDGWPNQILQFLAASASRFVLHRSGADSKLQFNKWNAVFKYDRDSLKHFNAEHFA
jgi:hypothetical protein